jgi:predicted nucleic acid-binding protein
VKFPVEGVTNGEDLSARGIHPDTKASQATIPVVGPVFAATQRQHRQSFVERLLAVLPVVPFDLVTARIHASLWAAVAAKGASVGAHDLLIGATAIAAGYRVATRDRRSFGRIPGLEVLIL